MILCIYIYIYLLILINLNVYIFNLYIYIYVNIFKYLIRSLIYFYVHRYSCGPLAGIILLYILHIFKICGGGGAADTMARPWGLLTPRAPKELFPTFQKIIWSRNRCFSYGCAPYFE